jgi:hypothetical protein
MLVSFRQIPRDLADWDRFFRQVPVTPDPNSVGDTQIQTGAVTSDKIAPENVDTAAVADGAITDSKLRDSAACSVIGRANNSSGTPADISLSVDDQFLVRRAGTITSGAILDSDIPATLARDTEVSAGDAASVATAAAALASHVAATDPHTGYQLESEKNAANGYAGLNASSRTTKGVDTTDDLVLDLATKGLVLKDTQGTPHYWRVTISNVGAIVTTDLGTTKP